MVGDMMSTGMVDQHKVRVKDSKALGGMRNSEADTVKLDFVNKFQNLSPARQKLMEKYFTLQGTGENCPYLAEYFAVALAFTALGALLREINGSNLRNHDQQGPPKIRRMALETMLKEAMDRLQVLAEERKVLEQRMRERKAKEATMQKERDELLRRATTAEFLVALKIQSESTWAREKEDLLKRVSEADAQRAYFFKHMTESEGHVAELQKLRAEDGKANARLVGIYASREQAWKVEKVKQAQEIESLKERNRKLNGQVKALVLHVERSAPSPETLRNRDLRRMKDSPPAKVPPQEKVSEGPPQEKVSEVVPNPTEQPTAQNAVVIDFEKMALGVKENEQIGDSEGPAMESLSQQQEMEAELANILKKVGQLKRRGNVGKMLSTAVKESESIEVKESAKFLEEAAIFIDDKADMDVTKDSQRKVSFENSIVQSCNMDVTPQDRDIAETTFQLDNSFTEGCQMPEDVSTERNVVKSNDVAARGEEHLLGGTTSSEQFENGLEQVEDNLDNMIVVMGAETQDSSMNESLLHPTLNIGAKVDRIIPVVVPDEACNGFSLLSTSYEDPNEAIGHSDGEVHISGNSPVESVLDSPYISIDKQQDIMVNSLDEEHGDVQDQEGNDGVTLGCKMVEPQTDLVEAVSCNSLQLPLIEPGPVSETITSLSLDDEVISKVPEDAQVHDSQEGVESMDNTTQVREQEPSMESVVFHKEQTTLKQDIGLLPDIVLINDKEYNPADECSAEGQIDSDEFLALSLQNDVINTEMEDSIVIDTHAPLGILGGDLDVSPESLSHPHVGSVQQDDDLIEVQASPDDGEVITSEESSQDIEAMNSVLPNNDLALDLKAMTTSEESSQDIEATNSVLPNEDLALDLKAMTTSEESSQDVEATNSVLPNEDLPLDLKAMTTSEESSQDVEATNSVLPNEDLPLDLKATLEETAIVGVEGLCQPPIHED